MSNHGYETQNPSMIMECGLVPARNEETNSIKPSFNTLAFDLVSIVVKLDQSMFCQVQADIWLIQTPGSLSWLGAFATLNMD